MSDNAMISNISSIFGNGDAADRLIANDFDIGVLRPWLGRDGRSYVTRTINGRPKILVSNAPATLTKDAWILFDTAVVRAVYARFVPLPTSVLPGIPSTCPTGWPTRSSSGRRWGISPLRRSAWTLLAVAKGISPRWILATCRCPSSTRTSTSVPADCCES
jgi:hypothetical protein